MLDWLDTRTLGEATLILVGAIVIGYFISKMWPKRMNPQLFGTLAAIALVGALAYIGNAGAAVALVVLIGAALVFGALAIGFG